MQSQTINWPTLWLALGPAIVAGFFTALGSYLIYRSQLKTKLAEIKGQSELRARELLFESYQQRIDRIGEGVNKFMGALYGFAGHLQALTDEEEKRQAQVGILVLINMTRDPILDSVGELEEELGSVDLATKRSADLRFIRETLSTELDKPDIDFGLVYLNFMKAFGLFNGLKEELLNKKCEALFNIYLEPKG
jgi:hypothetical protein